MPRHQTVSFPKKWIEEGGYWEESYQRDIVFTSEEEATRNEEEAAALLKQGRREQLENEQHELTVKLSLDTITDSEIRKLLRLERGL